VRVLFASTRGAGHFNPLVPFADACLRRGHEVLVCGPPSLAAAVESAGYEFWPFDDPPEDELTEVWSRVPSLSADEQNALVIGEIFARLHATASLPRLSEAVAEWQPNVVLRDPNEYGSALAAELHGVRHARVGNGLAAVEELAIRLSADRLGELRRSAGLAPDPGAEALRRSPYLTLFPPSFEDPAQPPPPHTLRFRDPGWDETPAELPAWWAGDRRPLVYVTFGSVAGAMPMAVDAYLAALEAVGDLSIRVLLTVGPDADPASFSEGPANVRVERWVSQRDVLGQAAAVVCHGGSGSTLGAIAAGLPLVVVPLFADQPYNARRVAALGAGLEAPPEGSAIRDALSRVLDEPSYGAAAQHLAAEARRQPSTDASVDALAELARSAGPR
jgi:UDP:flavonoid glycosyltransferase YjiC (YdhE family)